MEVHTMVFIHEHGPVIGTYPINLDDPAISTVSIVHQRMAMDMRFASAIANPACIAAFWYVNGTMKRYSFLRA